MPSDEASPAARGNDNGAELLTHEERAALLWKLYDALLTRLLAALTPEEGQPQPTAAFLDIARKVLIDHGVRASAMRTVPGVKRGLEALVADFSTLPFGKDDKAN